MTALARALPAAAFTLLPLVGVLWLGWDWREVVLLYWLENVGIGIAMFVRLRRGERAAVAAGGARDPLAFELSSFFALHYGIFTLVHGVFVVLIVLGVFSFGVGGPEAPLQWAPVLIVGAVGAALHLASVLVAPVRPASGGVMFSVYPRIFVLHFTVVLAALVIESLQWPAAAAVLLIVLHALIDGGSWLVSALVARRRAGDATPQPAE